MTTAAPIYVNPSGPGFKEFLSSDTISIPGSIALPTFTTGSVIFAGAGGVLAQDNANLFWDNANNRLGIGIAVPTSPLHVVGDLRVTNGLGVYDYVAGEAFSMYDVLYGDAAGGAGYFKKAVNATEAQARVVGVAVTGAAGATSGFILVTCGIFKMTFTGGVPAVGDLGKPVYLSAVAGSVSLTPPGAGSGLVSIRLGYLVGYGAAASNVAIHVGDPFVV
jgi:hypothetical protein